MSIVTDEDKVVRHRHRIVISGGLGEIGRQAFADLTIEPYGAGTALIGEFDQATLYDALHRVQSLGLELVALTRLSDGDGSHSQCGDQG